MDINEFPHAKSSLEFLVYEARKTARADVGDDPEKAVAVLNTVITALQAEVTALETEYSL